jgi:hypothetical protein
MATTKREKDEETKPFVGMAAGGTAGALTGAAIGAVMGGPVGAAAGASIGGLVGFVSGGVMSYDDVDEEFRRQYESSPTHESYRWEDMSPAYRYGWESFDRPEYHGKAWSQVESDLEKGWTGGRWSTFEPHIRHAWEHRASHHAQAGDTASPK